MQALNTDAPSIYLLSMKKQNLIKQTLSQPASIKYVKELLESKQIPNRAKLAEKYVSTLILSMTEVTSKRAVA